MHLATDDACGRFDGDDPLFLRIAADLLEKGWSVNPNALPPELAATLHAQLQSSSPEEFTSAGVGRSTDYMLNPFIRRDEIRWINGQTAAERDWLDWTQDLQRFLNRRLFLGLFSFESHFAHYRPGAFYKKHLDAFKSSLKGAGSNRVLSLVAYFNPGWQPDDGGELVMYDTKSQEPVLTVTPAFATLVVFLSEEVPHAVRPARRDRFSIAGWYRVNATISDRADPPQ